MRYSRRYWDLFKLMWNWYILMPVHHLQRCAVLSAILCSSLISQRHSLPCPVVLEVKFPTFFCVDVVACVFQTTVNTNWVILKPHSVLVPCWCLGWTLDSTVLQIILLKKIRTSCHFEKAQNVLKQSHCAECLCQWRISSKNEFSLNVFYYFSPPRFQHLEISVSHYFSHLFSC